VNSGPLNGVIFREMPYIIFASFRRRAYRGGICRRSTAFAEPGGRKTQRNIEQEETKDGLMGRIFQAIVILLIFAVLAVIGYAYFGDMHPQTGEQRLEVTLPGDTSGN